MSLLNTNNQLLTWRKNASSLTIVTFIFLLWGLITVLNSNMAVQLVNSAELPVHLQDESLRNEVPELAIEYRNLIISRGNILTFVFFGVYLLFAYPAGRLIKNIGYKKGMVSGLAMLAIGCLSVVASALLGQYYTFVIATAILGVGITLLQVAANPYVVFVSSPETSASRLTFVQAFNALGTFLAPLIIVAFSYNSIGYLIGGEVGAEQAEATRLSSAHYLIFPYLLLAGLIIVAAIILTVSNLPEANAIHLEGEPDENEKKSAWQYPHLIFAALAIFVYVGAEIAISSNLVNYYTEVQKVTGETLPFSPNYLIYIYFGGAILGRLFGAFLLKKNEAHNMVVMFAVLAAILVFVAFSGHNMIAVYCLTGVGLFNSILFPGIFSLGIRGLGKHSEEGSSIMIMAISGGAIVPFIFTFYHDKVQNTHDLINAVLTPVARHAKMNVYDLTNKFHHTDYDGALWIPFCCYMAIAFYGLFGYRFKRQDSVHFEKQTLSS